MNKKTARKKTVDRGNRFRTNIWVIVEWDGPWKLIHSVVKQKHFSRRTWLTLSGPKTENCAPDMKVSLNLCLGQLRVDRFPDSHRRQPDYASFAHFTMSSASCPRLWFTLCCHVGRPNLYWVCHLCGDCCWGRLWWCTSGMAALS